MKYVITGSDVGSLYWLAKVMNEIGSRCGQGQIYTVDGIHQPNEMVLIEPPRGRRARLRYEARLRRGDIEAPHDVSLYDGDSSIFAVPHIADLDDKVKVLHVVRDPIAAVSALYLQGTFSNLDDKQTIFISENLSGFSDQESPLARITYFVAHWDDALYEYKVPVFTIDKPSVPNVKRIKAVYEYLTDEEITEEECDTALMNVGQPWTNDNDTVIGWESIGPTGLHDDLYAKASRYEYDVPPQG